MLCPGAQHSKVTREHLESEGHTISVDEHMKNMPVDFHAQMSKLIEGSNRGEGIQKEYIEAKNYELSMASTHLQRKAEHEAKDTFVRKRVRTGEV